MKTMHFTVIAAGLALAAATGCKKDKPAQGPMERAGQAVDNAARDTKNAVKDGAENAGDAAKKTKDDVKRKSD